MPSRATLQAVINAGCVPRVVELLAHESSNVRPVRSLVWGGVVSADACVLPYVGRQIVAPALQCVGNIALGDDAQTQVVVDLDAVPGLTALMGHSKKWVRGVCVCGAHRTRPRCGSLVRLNLSCGMDACHRCMDALVSLMRAYFGACSRRVGC